MECIRRLSRPMVAALVALTAAAPASASESGASADAGALGSAVAAGSVALQRHDGGYRDPVQGAASTCYGDAMLGYGVLAAGIRTGERRLARSGTHAIRSATTHAKRGCAADHTFEVLALAASYRLAADEAAPDAVIARIAGPWRKWLRAQRVSWLYRTGYYNNRYVADVRFAQLAGSGPAWRARVRDGTRRPGFYNKQLVDALAVLELVHSRLSSSRPGAILGPGRARARRAARRLILRTIPQLMRTRNRPYLLSDDPAYPPAYHALDLALYARAITLLRPAASSAAIETLVAGARASAGLAAPDGSVAYWGRSQDQSWTLSASAYAARVAARYAEPGTAQVLNSLARRSLNALARYGLGPVGLDIVPVLSEDPAAGKHALDPWAGAPQYQGLTLVFLEWAARLPASGAEAEPAAMEQDRAIDVGRGSGRFVVVRAGPIWYAVKQLPTITGDARYDAGLVAAKRLTTSGWSEITPTRPRTVGDRSVRSVGPVLLANGERGIPVASRPRIASDGSVEMSLSFRSPSGRWLRRDVAVVWRPSGCGVTLELATKPGDRYEYAPFFVGRAAPPVSVAGETGPAGLDLLVTPTAARLAASVRAARASTGLASSAHSQVAQQVFHIDAAGTTIRIGHCDAL